MRYRTIVADPPWPYGRKWNGFSGGKVKGSVVLDHRIGTTVEAGDFDSFIAFVADVIGHCWGYGAHPRDPDPDRALFARVPHPSLAPHRVVGISAVREQERTDG